MKTLSIDTSSNICSVAILEDTNLKKELNLNNGFTHSEKLMPTIEQILLETNLTLKDINLLVCDIGPGSFTGIRIGISTTLAFKDSLNIKSVGISSLDVLAYNIKQNGLICSLIDAKNSNCYTGLYNLQNNKYTLINDLYADNIENILNNLKQYTKPITFVGDGAIANQDIIKKFFPNSLFSKNNNISSYNLGLAGIHSILNNNPAPLTPLYLRKSQAERILEEQQNANN